MRVGSLFSGIGGFDLGLERAGMRTVWFCEQDEFCRRVLARHWPGVPCHSDVRSLVADTERDDRQPEVDADEVDGTDTAGPASGVGGSGDGHEGRLVPVSVPHVDVLCGGFPCQDLSLAGKGAGIDGARSGLWSEFARLIGELRPRYVIVENVPALLGRGAGRVLGDLAALGFDAEWDCLPASAFGAPHRRDRLWIVAYPDSSAGGGAWSSGEALQRSEPIQRPRRCGGGHSGDLAYPDGERLQADEGRGRNADGFVAGRDEPPDGEDTDECALQPWRVGGRVAQAGGPEWWSVEPPVGRVAHGIPDRLDQLAALGNSLVPQIAEWIGRRIIEWESGMNPSKQTVALPDQALPEGRITQ